MQFPPTLIEIGHLYQHTPHTPCINERKEPKEMGKADKANRTSTEHLKGAASRWVRRVFRFPHPRLPDVVHSTIPTAQHVDAEVNPSVSCRGKCV